MTEERTVYNALPSLPGFNFAELNEPASHGRPHRCILTKEGVRMVKGAEPSSPQELHQGCGIPVRDILDKFHTWKTLDDKVLRFFACYTEDVLNSQTEGGVRVRKVKLYYYLADGTLAIVETPATINSGFRKGTTVSRFKPDKVDVFSFFIGASIACRGITYTLVDCDAATREFYNRMGMPQPEKALSYPYDYFEASKSRVRIVKDEESIGMRRVFEAQAATLAGTHVSLLTSEEREKARSYYAHDGKVLRYFAVWEKRLFRIHYYLSDGSISVMFDHVDNDGRDNNPVFIHRTRIPKGSKAATLSHIETLSQPLDAKGLEYISAKDLRTGTTVCLFTRPFFIYDCDVYTRQYVKEHYGIELLAHDRPLVELDEIDSGKRKARLCLKAIDESHTKDARNCLNKKSLGASAMTFGKEANEKNSLKISRIADDVFRFLACIANPHLSDECRKFIISYYLADDTVSVTELIVRNNGHVGGKIFGRRTVEGVDDPRKLHVGDRIRLGGIEYLLEAMDERTQKYIETGMLDSMDEAYLKLNEAIARMRQYVLQQFSSSTDAYRHYASSITKGLSAENVREMFSDSGVPLTPEMLERVMERVDRDRDGCVSLEEFIEEMLDQKLMSDFKARGTFASLAKEGLLHAHQNTPIPVGPIQSKAMLSKFSHAEAAATAAFRKFMAVVEARRTLLLRTFRSLATDTYDGNLGLSEVKDCLLTRLKVSLSEDELNALLYKFFYHPGVSNWEERRLNVNEIQQLIRL